MRLWLILAAAHLILGVIDGAVTASTSIAVDSWEEVLEPWGLDTSDGLTVWEVVLNPRLYTTMVTRILSWNYSVFVGTEVGVMLQSGLIAMTVAIFVYQARGVAGSLTRFVPWLR
ncbi:MAG: hypothetical protein F4X54_07500 [Chloroflexi bacterium]|nr:hypothetical protein [Chloroflexota bacterium]